jgi:hypothetical protein
VERKGNNLLVGCHYSQSFGGHSQIPYLQVRKREDRRREGRGKEREKEY